LYASYSLANRLNKTVYEIDQMTVEEFHGWFAFFKLEDKNNGN